jgi:hypothetical protein
MADGRAAKIFLTVLATFGGALWGYVLPDAFSTDWPWRLIALPAAFLVGMIVWSRLQGEMPAFAVEVPMGLRIFVTVSMSIVGFAGPFIWSEVLTRSWHLTLGVLLGVPLALILGKVAWRDPTRFYRNRRF